MALPPLSEATRYRTEWYKAFGEDSARIQAAATGFRDAVQYIKTNGWFQGDWLDVDILNSTPFPEGCKVCAMGAMAVVTGNTLGEAFDNPVYLDMDTYSFLRIKSITGAGDDLVGFWNDDLNRTVEDVIRFLETLAEELENAI